jgi:hypothetical protein
VCWAGTRQSLGSALICAQMSQISWRTTGAHQPTQHRQMDAGVLEPEIGSFRLHLAAEGKATRTIRSYTEAAAWFAATRLIGEAGKSRWEQADRRDVEEWMAWLLDHYSDAYASNQYREQARWGALHREWSPGSRARWRGPGIARPWRSCMPRAAGGVPRARPGLH